MTRQQKIAKARELKGEGRTAPQIGALLDVPASTIRNWCLGGDCEGCGALLDGSRGAKPTRCAQCVAAARMIWTPEAIIARVREWAERYGRPPGALDWSPALIRCASLTAATKRRKIARFEEGDWPSTTSVQERFGSWSAALRAAGFEPNPTGFAGRWDKAA